jgi:small multidrug resistance pump
MSWAWLVGAILCEVAGTTSMKQSEGFKHGGATLLMFFFYGLSLSAMSMALKEIPVSVAYAIWSGLGTALIAAIGIFWYREAATAIKLASLSLIIMGVAGLHLSSGGH